MTTTRSSACGAGIPPDHLPHIFDRFYRTDHARSRASGGTGLGLAITRALITAQGGEIEAHSPGAGLGSTFRIRLTTLYNLTSTAQNTLCLLQCKENHRHFCPANFGSFPVKSGQSGAPKTSDVLIYRMFTVL